MFVGELNVKPTRDTILNDSTIKILDNKQESKLFVDQNVVIDKIKQNKT